MTDRLAPIQTMETKQISNDECMLGFIEGARDVARVTNREEEDTMFSLIYI